MIKFYCQLAKQNNACGIQHPSHGAIMIASDAADGAIAANADTTQVTSNTYVMKKTEIEAWLTNSLNLSSTSYAVPNTSIADPFFQFFYCGGSRDHNYTCYKYQPRSSTDGNPRFDPGTSGAKGVYYITGGAAPTTKAVTFSGAMMGYETATAFITAAVLAMSLF